MSDIDQTKQIQELINRLRELSKQSGATGTAFDVMVSQINKLESALNTVGNGKGLANLAAQAEKVSKQLASIATGQEAAQSRFYLAGTGGQRLNLAPFQKANTSNVIPSTAVANPTVQPAVQPSTAGAIVAPTPSFGDSLVADQWKVLKGNESQQAKALAALKKLELDEQKDNIESNKKLREEEQTEIERTIKAEQAADKIFADNAKLKATVANEEKLAIEKQREIFQKEQENISVPNKQVLQANKTQTGLLQGAVDQRLGAIDQQQVNLLKQAVDQKKKILADQELQEKDRQRLIKLGEQTMTKEEAFLNKYDQLVARKASIQAQEAQQAKKKESPYAGTQLESVQGAGNALSMASKIDPNFTIDTLKKVTTEGSTGMSRLAFSYETVDKITKQLTVTLDKFGRPLVDTQKKFRSFADGIARDTLEFLKWSIAASIVYVPLQKLGELMGDMITIQSQLADVQISLASSTKDLNDVWTASYEIAQKTGEGITGVVEAYNLAYRATGGMASETERFTVANKLLYDAITLSKLSTLDQAESIDILSAALKQTNIPLDQGTKLLDKWVKTTKVANVDLTALATGFSVVGDAAETAGVGVDKLNAIIAVMAESSGSAPKELANTVKALIGGFQSDQAQQALGRLGVSVVDTTGKMRGFVDIMQQLYDLRKSGQLGDTDFSKLTLALGGGTRRQAAYSTFIENFGKVATVEQASMSASGDASQALETKLDTLQTSLEKLNNAFQGLAQSLGTKGGLLDIFKLMVDGTTFLVESFTKLMDILGKAGPVLLTTAATMALLNGDKNSGLRAGIANNIGSTIAGILPRSKSNDALQNRLSGVSSGNYDNQQITSEQRGQAIGGFIQKNGATIAGAGITLVSSIQNFASGDTLKGVGSLIAGGIGTALGGPMGAAIGISISDAFYSATIGHKAEFANLFTPTNEQPKPTGASNLNGEDQKAEALKELYKTAGFGSESYGKVRASLDQFFSNWIGGLQNLTGNNGGTKFTGVSQEQGALLAITDLKDAGAISQSKYDEIINLMKSGVKVDQKEQPNPVTAQTEVVNAGITRQVVQEYEKKLKDDFYAGNITRKELTTGQESLSGLGVAGSIWSTALKGALGPDQKAYEQFGKVQAYGSEVGKTDITTLANQINSIMEQITKLSGADFVGSQAQLNQLSQQELDYRKQLIEVINRENKLIDEQAASKKKNLSIGNFDMTSAEFDKLVGLNGNAPGFQKFQNQAEASGVTVNPEDQAVLFADKWQKVANKDWKLVQMYLSEILKVNQKQLDGMYNLPEGATFWVPYQAAKYGLNQSNEPPSTDKYKGKDLVDPTTQYSIGNQVSPDIQKLISSIDKLTGVMGTASGSVGKEIAGLSGKGRLDSSLGTAGGSVGMDKSLSLPQPSSASNPFDLSGIMDAIKNLQATFKFTVESKSTLIMDGKVMAEAMSKYLNEKLLKFGASAGVGQRVSIM